MAKNKLINIFLDDVRPCPEGFVPARNYAECIALIKENEVDAISFDHDLGEDKSGYDVAKFIIEATFDNVIKWPQRIFIHTSNPPGRENIYQLFERYKDDSVMLFKHPYNRRQS